MRRRRTDDTTPGSWIITYSDLMSLLLAFFVLLFSFSTIDARKFQQALLSMRGALGVLSGGRMVLPEVLSEPPLPPDIDLPRVGERWIFTPDVAQMLEVEQQVREALATAGLEEAALIRIEERGLLLRFPDSVFFDSGRADLRPEGVQLLDALKPVLAQVPNPIRVEGHTDNVPINTYRYPSNWELSSARAGAVIRYLLAGGELEPERFSSAGYGEYRPVADNSTAEGRQLNRRVDIVLLFMGRSESGS